MATWREELAWCAGFFDGEGHIGTGIGRIKGKWTSRPLRFSASQTDRFVLDRFRDAVGVGRVTGPYANTRRRPNEAPAFFYQVARFEFVQAVVALLWTWLSPVKREQAHAALLAMRARPTHKGTCRRGHPRTEENTYIYGKWRACRECRKMATAAFNAAHPGSLKERWTRSNRKRAAKRKLVAALLES